MTDSTNTTLDTRLTVPNIMTAARLVMAVAAAALFAFQHMESVAVSLCLAGIVLDAMDGWYARRFGQCSHLGRFLDPLADKVLMAVMYGVIAIHLGSLVVWLLFILISGRDIAITLSRTLFIRKQGSTYGADWTGKTKMVVQSAAGTGLLTYAYVFDGGFLYYPSVISLAVIAALSYVSAGRYLLTASPRS